MSDEEVDVVAPLRAPSVQSVDWLAAAAAVEARITEALLIPPALIAMATHDIDVSDLGGLFAAKCSCGEREMGGRVRVLTWAMAHRYHKAREALGA